MKYSVIVTAAATLLLVACNRQPLSQRSSGTEAGDEVSQVEEPPAAGQLQPDPSLPADADSHAPEEQEADRASAADDAPPLLLDDEPPLTLDDAPLLLDDGPLLLLDGGEETSGAPAGPVADNSRCHHCHLNYEIEELAVDHARANIGCADCHGQSDAHIADESWASGGNGTAPDVMYLPEKIVPFCNDCHPKEEMDPDEHKDFFAGLRTEKVCTDCHGEHRLETRQCKWK